MLCFSKETASVKTGQLGLASIGVLPGTKRTSLSWSPSGTNKPRGQPLEMEGSTQRQREKYRFPGSKLSVGDAARKGVMNYTSMHQADERSGSFYLLGNVITC